MNLKIAVCDDEKLQTDYLSKLASQWAKIKRHSIRIFTYPSAEAFLFDYSEDKSFDILLLDVEMEKMSGVELAKKIRQDNHILQIIFVTGFYEYFSDGFDVSALHYLIKPASPEKLWPVLDRAAANLSGRERSILADTPDGAVRIPLADITYLESDRMQTVIHTSTGRVFRTKRKGISKFQSELDSAFIRIHRSFIVNLRAVSRITRTAVYVDCGAELPLSRGLYDEVHAALIRQL